MPKNLAEYTRAQ
ncbi:unnamed protein product, partial [Rotaria sp. Silwood1]